MSYRQAVVQIGQWSVKAGLWEQTFLPTHSQLTNGCIQSDISQGIVDAEKLEEILFRILLQDLQLTAPLKDVTVLLAVPWKWSKATRHHLAQMLLKPKSSSYSNSVSPVGGVYITDAPVMAAFATAQSTVLVVDAGHFHCHVVAVSDGEVLLPSGGQTISFELDPSSDTIDFALAASQISEAAVAVLQRTDFEKRSLLLENVLITGGRSENAEFKQAIQAALSDRLLCVSAFPGDGQCRSLKIISVPEFYSQIWQQATVQAVWFGSGLTAKCVLNDHRLLINAEDLSKPIHKLF